MMIVAPPNHRARSALSQRKKKGNKVFPPRPPTPHPQVCPATPSPTSSPSTAGPQPLHCWHSSCHIPLLPCRPFAPTTGTLRGFGRFCYSRCCCCCAAQLRQRNGLRLFDQSSDCERRMRVCRCGQVLQGEEAERERVCVCVCAPPCAFVNRKVQSVAELWIVFCDSCRGCGCVSDLRGVKCVKGSSPHPEDQRVRAAVFFFFFGFGLLGVSSVGLFMPGLRKWDAPLFQALWDLCALALRLWRCHCAFHQCAPQTPPPPPHLLLQRQEAFDWVARIPLIHLVSVQSQKLECFCFPWKWTGGGAGR